MPGIWASRRYPEGMRRLEPCERISGTYDTRWNNSVLNPAFRALTANDFEVIRLGYQSTLPLPVAPSNFRVVN